MTKGPVLTIASAYPAEFVIRQTDFDRWFEQHSWFEQHNADHHGRAGAPHCNLDCDACRANPAACYDCALNPGLCDYHDGTPTP